MNKKYQPNMYHPCVNASLMAINVTGTKNGMSINVDLSEKNYM